MVPVIIGYNIAFLGGWPPGCWDLFGPWFMVAIINLWLLARGRLVWTAHLLFWLFMVGAIMLVIYPLHKDRVAGVVIRMEEVTRQTELEKTVVQSEKIVSPNGLPC